MNNIKMILFDLDGTLWNSCENVAESWNVVIRKWRSARPELPLRLLNADDIRGVMGKPMSEIAIIFFGDLSEEDRQTIARECETYEVEYIAEHGGVLFPEVGETLHYLQDKGCRLAIVSNCQSGYIETFLEHYGFGKHFDDIECYGNNLKGKGDNIALIVSRNGLDKAWYVGDIQGDYNSTMEAGIDFIHSAYGFGTINHPVPELERFSDLPELMKKLDQ
mgnify:CR=1 FL=1